jgi:outer membrane protein OmpA-like peptidoglycan-associated protein
MKRRNVESLTLALAVIIVSFPVTADTLMKDGHAIVIGKGQTTANSITWTDCRGEKSAQYEAPPYWVDKNNNCEMNAQAFGVGQEHGKYVVANAEEFGKYFPGARKGDEVSFEPIGNGVQIALSGRVVKLVSGIDPSVPNVDQKAQAAGQQADQAQTLANNAVHRVDTLQNAVANLENYRVVTETSVHFGFNKDNLTKDAKASLDQLATDVPNTKGYILTVEGGTDSVGDSEYNYELSQRRADSVIQYLASERNVPAYKIYVIGLGKDKPVDSNTAKEGRAKNRRVDVRLMTSVSNDMMASVKGKISDDGRSFVSDEDGKTWAISNPDAVKGHEGHHVTLKAHVDPGKGEVHVMSMKMAEDNTKKDSVQR